MNVKFGNRWRNVSLHILSAMSSRAVQLHYEINTAMECCTVHTDGGVRWNTRIDSVVTCRFGLMVDNTCIKFTEEHIDGVKAYKYLAGVTLRVGSLLIYSCYIYT